MPNDFLEQKHPIYEASQEEWRRCERRLHGGEEVLDDLAPFDHEVAPALPIDRATQEVPNSARGHDRYVQRQRQAVYLNFPDMLATSMVGHLLASAPEMDSALDFGGLGKVRRTDDQNDESNAELIYYNVDGVGNDGSQWYTWWAAVARRSLATGHRWLYVDLPAEGATDQAQVLAGSRPFLLEYSPLVVTNWYYEQGRLQFAVLQLSARRPRRDGDRIAGNDFEREYALFTRAGYGGLGDDFNGGGWWLFDKDRDPLEVEGVTANGNWDAFNGEVPLWAHYYERDPGTTDRPALSRSATTQLGQAAVAYMNLDSAAIFDAWDAAMSMLFFLGIGSIDFNDMVRQKFRGSRWIGTPPTVPEREVGDLPAAERGMVPVIHDSSTGAVESAVFDTALRRIVDNAGKLAAQEATSTPDSTGRSKEAGFADLKAPRLALMASEMEQSQNTAIAFLEKAFGVANPAGVVRWTREFNLLSLVDHVAELFDVVAKTGVRSARLDAKALALSARERGIITDDEEAAEVEAEFIASAWMKQMEEMSKSMGAIPPSAKGPVIMAVLEGMGLFIDAEGNEVPGLRAKIEAEVATLAEQDTRQREQELSFFEGGGEGDSFNGGAPGEGAPPRRPSNVGAAK